MGTLKNTAHSLSSGYGGGYMDRQNVEYIKREDNEEFDEFGRKKKRRKMDEVHFVISVLLKFLRLEIYQDFLTIQQNHAVAINRQGVPY